jgi:hypothetical protein
MYNRLKTVVHFARLTWQTQIRNEQVVALFEYKWFSVQCILGKRKTLPKADLLSQYVRKSPENGRQGGGCDAREQDGGPVQTPVQEVVQRCA